MKMAELFRRRNEPGGGPTPPSGSGGVGFTGGYDLHEVYYERTLITFDCSSSMLAAMLGSGAAHTRLDAAKVAGRGFVEKKIQKFMHDPERFQGEIGVIAFAENVKGYVPLKHYEDCERAVLPFLDSLEADGTTAFCEPQELAERLFRAGRTDDPDVLDHIIFLTDGDHNGPGDPELVARRLKETGLVVIDTIGIGQTETDVNRELLEAMASTIDGNLRYRFISDAGDLIDHFFTLAGTLSG